jgi:NAD(P)-dependent dehydrogenase (short-subunit alcohol dehydrogenase family)
MAGYFGRRGYTVAVNGRSPEAVNDTVAELTRAGVPSVAAAADITDPTAVTELVARLEAGSGPVVAMIHNATLRKHAPIGDMSIDDWEAVLGTVLTGGFVCAKAVVPAMRERRWGRLIFIGGHSAQSGVPGGSATGAAKNGLFGLTKALARELGPDGITVNCISPGVIDTERAEPPDPGGGLRHLESGRMRALERVPAGRAGQQEEVAAMAHFLCEDAAAYVNGQVIGVNGGLYL